MTTDRLAFNLAPTMLILGCLLFMVPAAWASDSSCEPAQYPIQNGSKIAGCRDCHDCGKGLEPVIPCGTVIDNNQSVGNCRPCRNGTFSATNNKKPCHICQKPKCLEHEIVLQNCTDTFDDSRCSGICVKGLIMNKEKTECKFYEAQQKITTEQPQQNSTTKSPILVSNETSEKAMLPVVAIVFIIIGSLVVTVISIVAVCWYFYKMCRMDPRANKSCNGSASTSTELLDMETGILIKQDEGKENGAHVMKKPQCETGFGADASATDTSSNGQVAFEVQVTHPESMMSAPLKSPCPAPLFQQPHMMNVRPVPVGDPGRPDMMLAGRHAAPPGPHRVVGLEMNAATYERICNLLSGETVNNNWKILAGRMGYDNGKVKQFETAAKCHKTYPADVLFDHWSKLSCKNDVAKLKELAGQIQRDDIVQLLEH